MAAYLVVENDIALDVSPATEASSFTHVAKVFNVQLNPIYSWIENAIGNDDDFPIVTPPMYTGILDTERPYYIDNEVSGPWSPAAFVYENVMLETELTQWLDDATALWVNPLTDLEQRRHNNYKITGIIFPRLYDWTGVNHGTFR